MAKKKLDKEVERTPSSPGKIAAILKNETVHFVIGLMLVIFSVYLLLAFSSFFFIFSLLFCFQCDVVFPRQLLHIPPESANRTPAETEWDVPSPANIGIR